ncbi:MAG TPA: protein kinase [Candidatus Polarisedimenticolia bacterium]|jgi:serine/threonine protein kinase
MALTLVKGKELDDRYVIHESIGAGGYGSVWKASDKQLSRDVALKWLLKRPGAVPGDDTARLLSEARKHAGLVHTNIVQVYDVIECEGEHLIVMEYVDGPSLNTILRDFAKKGEVLPLDQASSVLRDVLSGVAFAHDKKIVHRDLSPSNILLTSTGIPKLGDFGIARVLDPQSNLAPSSSVHGGTGNPNYMAPEQHRGEEADASSDLFMVGIIGYLLLTGRHPFAHPSGLFSIPDFIRDENFTPDSPRPLASLTASQQRLFREYAAVVTRLLNRERAGRFASAREAIEVIEDLEPFQECPQCGERIPEHYRFCGFCGSTLEERKDIPVPQPVPVHQAEESADDLVDRGYHLSRLRRWDDAIALYRDAIKKDARNDKAYRNLGFALNRMGRCEEADAALSKGLEVGPDQPSHEASLRHERAYARAELKRYDEALVDVQRALELIPYSTKSRYLRARIRLLRGDRLDAKSDAIEVLRQVPDHLGALRLLDQLGGA